MTKEYRLKGDDGYTKEYAPVCDHSRFTWCSKCGPEFTKAAHPPTPEQLARADKALKEVIDMWDETDEND